MNNTAHLVTLFALPNPVDGAPTVGGDGSMPKGVTHWSTRLMARARGATQNAAMRIWHAFGPRPHLQETFKLATDARREGA